VSVTQGGGLGGLALGYYLAAPSGRRTGHSEGPAGPEATGARIEAVDSPRAKPGPYTLRVFSKIFCSVLGFGGCYKVNEIIFVSFVDRCTYI
jgi:hypothetical protein